MTPLLIDETSVDPKAYEDLSWKGLPQHVQEAAKQLGYTPAMWNEDEEPESSDKEWNELSLEEKTAAKVMGYNETTWNADDRELTPKDYDGMSWKQLPSSIQEAYKVLGYDKEKWNRDESPAALEKNWLDLPVATREAATRIGYNEAMWNDGESDEVEAAPPQQLQSPTVLRDEQTERRKYEGTKWEDLPRKALDAAECLGYTREIWDKNKEPEASDKFWEELDPEERTAAELLGYAKASWRFSDQDVRPGDYDELYWNQLPEVIQEAYRLLGYTANLWDRDESPASFDKGWDELTEEERNGATTVGYTEETWDDDAIEEESRVQATGFRGQIFFFFKGSSYILLDCVSMSAFFNVIESVFLIGKLLLSDAAINALKIVFGLAIMQYCGQLRKWLGAEKETKKARSRRNRKDISLFRSFLNIFSWWTVFGGVNHFFYAFEKDILYKYAEDWFSVFYEIAENAFQAEVANGTAEGNMTCSYVKNFEYNNTVQGFIIGRICAMSESEWESMGYIYYCVVFAASALPMWLLFGDNFLRGCDV